MNLIRTTAMLELINHEKKKKGRTCTDSLFYLLLTIPLYTCSAYSRLGSLSLSCIFFGYWTVLPVLILACIFGVIGYRTVGGFAFFLIPCNIFIMCTGPVTTVDD